MTSERDRQIVRLREEGLTLDEIGRRFGLTRERVRQIASAGGVSTGDAGGAKRRRDLDAARRVKGALMRGYRAGRSAPEMAKEHGITHRSAEEVIRYSATAEDRAHRSSNSAKSKLPLYTQAQLAAAVRRVAEHLGNVPSSKNYADLAPELGLPSLPTVIQRFGTWAAAVQAAGMVSRAAARTYTRRWSDAACWSALEALVQELGEMPTAQQYEVLAAGNDDLPSLATVRNRLGRWSEVASALLATSHDNRVLRRLGISGRSDRTERNETIWLAYLSGEATEQELHELLECGLFDWDDSYGPKPVL